MLLQAFLVSCQSGKNTPSEVKKPDKNDMANLNQYLVQKDREIIESYAERKGLKMTESPTGLWYSIDKNGSGNTFRENDRVVFNFECDLLDGTRCYSSDISGARDIIIGKSKIEQGLSEGLKLLSPGAEATFIIPPHLAFGLLGDGSKIPPRAIIIYKVKIL